LDRYEQHFYSRAGGEINAILESPKAKTLEGFSHHLRSGTVVEGAKGHDKFNA